jgi:hypothetical protein
MKRPTLPTFTKAPKPEDKPPVATPTEAQPKGQKAPKAPKTPKRRISPQGFLLPESYKQKVIYRENLPFRLTLPAFIILWVVVAAITPLWIYAKGARTNAEKFAATIAEQDAKATTRITSLKPVRDKYREIQTLRKQLRVPFTPVLSAIERAIPNGASLLSATWNCDTTSSDEKHKRTATLQLQVYYPEGNDPMLGENNQWPTKLEGLLENTGASPTKAEWGSVTPYQGENPSTGGKVRPLSLSFELEN